MEGWGLPCLDWCLPSLDVGWGLPCLDWCLPSLDGGWGLPYLEWCLPSLDVGWGLPCLDWCLPSLDGGWGLPCLDWCLPSLDGGWGLPYLQWCLPSLDVGQRICIYGRSPKNWQLLSPPLSTAVEGGTPGGMMCSTYTLSMQLDTFPHKFPQNGSFFLLFFFNPTNFNL